MPKIPPYGGRRGWRPRSTDDFADGGAFPEVLIAQYPLDLGRKSSKASNAIAIRVDSEGNVKYDALAKQGHREGRIVHSAFKDLIPLRQQAESGDISLDRPPQSEVAEQTQKTKDALSKLISGAVAAQKPKQVHRATRSPTYVRYTPANQMGNNAAKSDRIMKIVERPQDPMEPPKFKHKKIPRGPPSPPPPVLRSPPRKLTAEDQEAWKIPPPVSNWKNPKGYTVPLDKRVAADGRGLQDVSINDKFAHFAEALFTADRHAREEVKQRAAIQQKVAERQKLEKEEQLRTLAQRAREHKAVGTQRNGQSDSRTEDSMSLESASGSDEDYEAAAEREGMRRERQQANEKQLRQTRMGAERRLQVMAREQNRDISEKVALGLAKPTKSSETMYDARLFNQASGFSTGFNEDQAYDKPLFAAHEAINSLYRPRENPEDDGDNDDGNAGSKEYDKISKTNRFEALGQPKDSFKGTKDQGQSEGPVQFEKDTPKGPVDPFQIDEMIREVTEGAARSNKHGLTERDGARKRPRHANVI